jgi:membrane protein YdbS with pleckstrin-like domain
MVDQGLFNYIKVSLEKGNSKASIISALRKSGWPSSEIDSAFKEISHESMPPVPSHSKQKVLHGTAGTGFHAKFFRLQDGEKIHFESKPLRGLLWYMLIQSLIGLFFLFIFVIPFFVMPYLLVLSLGSASGGYLGMAIMGLFILIIIFLIDLVLVKRRYDMRYYWLTNNRIIVKRGLIGYSINSIPLERISDVLISRSFLERIFGFGSLHVQTLAGQYTVRGRGGAEGNLKAIPHPENNQSLIFDLIKKRRKSEHLTM